MKNKLLLFVFFAVALLSCEKFLDKKSSNTITTPITLADLQALLDDALYMNQTRTPAMGEAASDNYYLRPGRLEARETWLQMLYVWKPYEYYYPNDWSSNYTPVFNANYCLDMIKKISSNQDNRDSWNNVYGSALFFRAYYFLMLSWNYAKAYNEATAQNDLGIVLRKGSDFNVPSARASVQQSYSQIIADAKESIAYLPALPAHVYRPSKCAAYGLLARTYLSMRLYDSAYKYANLALEIKSDLMDFNGDDGILGVTRALPFQKFNKETIFYTEMSGGGASILLINTYIAVDSSLYADFESDDLRKQAYFQLNGGYYTFKGNYTQTTAYFTGIATDELILIKAECAARINNNVASINEAKNNIGQLLSKRYKSNGSNPTANITNNELLPLILKERRKELMFRGLRWMDIKRLNLEGANIILKKRINDTEYQLLPNASFYALPLPADVITLAGIEQN